MKRSNLVAGGIAVVFVIAAGGCTSRAQAPAENEPIATPAPGTVAFAPGSPMLAELHRAKVALADLPTEEVVAPGKIEANPNRVSKVLLPVGGRITSVSVKVGDAVKAGDPLLTVEGPDADSAVSGYLTADANVAQARAGIVKAQADYDRASDLFEHNAIAKKEVLSAESALVQAKAVGQQTDALLEQARRRLDVLGLSQHDARPQVVVRSPLAGKVLELSVVPGEYRNDTTASVMTVADLATVWVSSQVPESYIRFVQIGERVDISLLAYPGETFTGHVSRIADTVDPQTRTVKVHAEMKNPDGRFRPEMYGRIHHIESTAQTIVVPAGAVLERDTGSVVFVETSPGVFAQRRVTLGARVGDLVRVKSGVEIGDTVVVDGVMLLKNLVKAT
jgi:cobalt-zinc-cadmium efflux system membrane fusion protein